MTLFGLGFIGIACLAILFIGVGIILLGIYFFSGRNTTGGMVAGSRALLIIGFILLALGLLIGILEAGVLLVNYPRF